MITNWEEYGLRPNWLWLVRKCQPKGGFMAGLLLFKFVNFSLKANSFFKSRYYQPPLHIPQYLWYFSPLSTCWMCCRIAYSFASSTSCAFSFLHSSKLLYLAVFLLTNQNRRMLAMTRKTISEIHKVFFLITMTSFTSSSEFTFRLYITINTMPPIIMSNCFTNQISTCLLRFTRNIRIYAIL